MIYQINENSWHLFFLITFTDYYVNNTHIIRNFCYCWHQSHKSWLYESRLWDNYETRGKLIQKTKKHVLHDKFLCFNGLSIRIKNIQTLIEYIYILNWNWFPIIKLILCIVFFVVVCITFKYIHAIFLDILFLIFSIKSILEIIKHLMQQLCKSHKLSNFNRLYFAWHTVGKYFIVNNTIWGHPRAYLNIETLSQTVCDDTGSSSSGTT